MLKYIVIICIIFIITCSSSSSNYVDETCIETCQEQAGVWGNSNNEKQCVQPASQEVIDGVDPTSYKVTDKGIGMNPYMDQIMCSVVVKQTNTIILAGVAGPKLNNDHNDMTSIFKSTDNGRTFVEKVLGFKFQTILNIAQSYSGTLIFTGYNYVYGSTSTSGLIGVSIDGGETFVPATTTIGWGNIMFTAVETAETDHIVVGSRVNSNGHMNVYHSYDGGFSYNEMNLIVNSAKAAWISNVQRIGNDIFVSMTCWVPHSYGTGLYRSRDHGKTFKELYQASTTSVVYFPAGPYAGKGITTLSSPSRIYVTDDLNAESPSFTVAFTFEDFILAQLIVSEDGVLYAGSVTNDATSTNPPVYLSPAERTGQLYRSTDGGVSFHLFSDIQLGNYRAVYPLLISSGGFLIMGTINWQNESVRCITAAKDGSSCSYTYPHDNDGGPNILVLDLAGTGTAFDPSASVTTCQNACANDPNCCVYTYNDGCCTLRSEGCYERSGISSLDSTFPHMCSTEDNTIDTNLISGAGDCHDWCANKGQAPVCGKDTLSCEKVDVPQNLRRVISSSRVGKMCNINKQSKIIGANKLAKKIYASVLKTMAVPKRASFNPRKKERVFNRIYERIQQNVDRWFKLIGAPSVKLISVKIAAKLHNGGRRLLTSDDYVNEVTYAIEYNSTDETEMENFIEEALRDDPIEQIATDLLADTEFMEGEETFTADQVYARDDLIEVDITQDNLYDPEDPKWCSTNLLAEWDGVEATN